MNNEVRIPDIEIVVRAAASDVALVCFWAPDKPDGDWEGVGAISDEHDIVHIRAGLQAAIQYLNAARWQSLDELDQDPDEGTQDPPF